VNLAARLTAYRNLEKLQARHPTRIRLIYRVVRRGSQGPQLLAAALEAHAQGKFDELMAELQTTRTSLGREQVLDLVKKIGMDPVRVDAAIRDDRYRDVLDANERRFDRLHGSSAPNILFNSRPPKMSIGSLRWSDTNDGQNDYEREYVEALERAQELIDRGVDARALGQVFDDQALRSTQPFVVSSGPVDDEPTGADPSDHRLADPPLDLRGLPWFGRPDTPTPVPLVVVGRPNQNDCNALLRSARRIQEIYDEVRVVWAPYFDVTLDRAAEMAMLGDATLCAEQIGSSPDDLNASPGWRWITKQYEHSQRVHNKYVPAEKLIDTVAIELEVDQAKLAACRARLANTTLDWVAAARRSGLSRTPALVIGGRIYEGLADQNIIQQLIEAELAPGVLGEVAPSWRSTPK
jgi:hypothetical protein